MWVVLGVFLLPGHGAPLGRLGEEPGYRRPLASLKHRSLLQLALALTVLTTCRSNDKTSRIPL
uniref:Uncharacterized protein n=1 Tax=Arundo donax TaxID=35708 RepID=A0A0A9HQI9_ARUDO